MYVQVPTASACACVCACVWVCLDVCTCRWWVGGWYWGGGGAGAGTYIGTCTSIAGYNCNARGSDQCPSTQPGSRNEGNSTARRPLSTRLPEVCPWPAPVGVFVGRCSGRRSCWRRTRKQMRTFNGRLAGFSQKGVTLCTLFPERGEQSQKGVKHPGKGSRSGFIPRKGAIPPQILRKGTSAGVYLRKGTPQPQKGGKNLSLSQKGGIPTSERGQYQGFISGRGITHLRKGATR